MKTIAIASDHAGFELKSFLKTHFKDTIIFKDFGCHSIESVDYPDFVHPLAEAIENQELETGILICGSANGVAITANKYQKVRAALCWLPEIATLARNHNNANILCLPARFLSQKEAIEILSAFLLANFEGGRHQNRVDKITCP